MLAMVQPCWIVVQWFPALLSAIHPSWLLKWHCLPGHPPQGQVSAATWTSHQKHSGHTSQNFLLKT